MDRSRDWMRQAERDLEQAGHNKAGEYYELSCFLAQQAAEKAVKSLCQALRIGSRRQGIGPLLRGLPEGVTVPEDVSASARTLDRHYVAARYPDGLPGGAPMDHFGPNDAEDAITHAGLILAFCRQHRPE